VSSADIHGAYHAGDNERPAFFSDDSSTTPFDDEVCRWQDPYHSCRDPIREILSHVVVEDPEKISLRRSQGVQLALAGTIADELVPVMLPFKLNVPPVWLPSLAVRWSIVIDPRVLGDRGW